MAEHAIKIKVATCAVLMFLILVAYLQVSEFAFLNYDDDTYVTANINIQKGLSIDSILWALTAEVSGNWHPITLISHMTDYHVFGLDAGMHHITNLIFHLANSLLLFLVLCRLSPEWFHNAFIAALFAIHPLHVESVAWISERKDVLSTCFFFLTLWSYSRYTDHPGARNYLLIIVFFILGLASKPMLVTLPFILILLDIWPLKRIVFTGSTPDINRESSAFKLLYEKIPLFLLSGISCIITIYFQKGGAAIASTDHFSPASRISNAIVSYVLYLKKALWPFDLSIFYPHPGMPPTPLVAASLVVLLFASIAAFILIKKHPWLFTGWFWYLGTLVPVIGIVQVGSQAMADRYTYIPLIGIFIIISHGLPLIMSKVKNRYAILATVASFIIVIFTAVTWVQAGYFKNSKTLFQHAIDTGNSSAIIHNNYGEALAEEGRLREAGRHFSRAVQISPFFETAHNNLGNVLTKLGRPEKAEYHYRKAIELDPDFSDAYNNLGILMYSENKIQEAIECFESAIRINPDSSTAKRNLTIVLKKMEEK